jgi:hypothetical protein
MSLIVETITKFVNYAATLAGDEKGEAQVFCDRLFQAFGHQGYKEGGYARIPDQEGEGDKLR